MTFSMPRAAAAVPPAASSALVIDANVNNFMTEVIEASLRQPVILDFWSPRSPMCKQLLTVLEKAVQDLKGAVKLAKVNIDTNPEIAQQFRVQSVPTVYALFQGQPVDGFSGSQTEPQIQKWLQRIVKATGGAAAGQQPGVDEALKQAEAALAGNDWQTAQDLYSDILGLMPESAVAYAGLARCLIAAGQIEDARAMLTDAPEAIKTDKALEAARSALELADQAAAAGPVTELAVKVESNPTDHQARFDLALALVAAGQREGAVEHLLEIVRRQRNWNEEAARKQLVKLFEAFGATDPVTVNGRRQLSSILFA